MLHYNVYCPSTCCQCTTVQYTCTPCACAVIWILSTYPYLHDKVLTHNYKAKYLPIFTRRSTYPYLQGKVLTHIYKAKLWETESSLKPYSEHPRMSACRSCSWLSCCWSCSSCSRGVPSCTGPQGGTQLGSMRDKSAGGAGRSSITCQGRRTEQLEQ